MSHPSYMFDLYKGGTYIQTYTTYSVQDVLYLRNTILYFNTNTHLWHNLLYLFAYLFMYLHFVYLTEVETCWRHTNNYLLMIMQFV
jgi:hypothetical protein